MSIASDVKSAAPSIHSQDLEDARALNDRLRSEFEEHLSPEARRGQVLSQLLAGLNTGRFGGKPHEGDAPAALVSLLDQLKWTYSVEQFARVIPHFSEEFGIVQLRECAARLGFHSSTRIIKARSIFPRQLPALLVHGSHISLLKETPEGQIAAYDPVSGAPRKVNWRQKCQIVSFAQCADTEDKKTSGSWLLHNLNRFYPEIWQMFALTFFINLMVLVTSFAVMSIYDKVIPAHAFDTLTGIAIALAFAFVVELSFRGIKSKLIGRTTGRLEYLVGSAVFSKLVALPVHMVTNTPIGDQISRLRQFESVRDLFSGPFVAVGLEVPFIIMFMIGLFAVAGPLGAIPLVLMCVYAVVGFLMVGLIRRRNERSSRRQREHAQLTLETVSNLRQIRALGCETVWLERLQQKTADSSAARRRASMAQRYLSTLSSAAVPIAGAGTVITGALLVIDGQMTVGMLIGAMIIVWRVLAPIQQLFLMFSRYTEIAQMIKQIDQMMRLPTVETNKLSPLKRHFQGRIEFDRVSLRYQGGSDSALQGISLEIEPGELIAIQGHSGAGKSTLLRLVLELYRPQSGSVLVDGINVQQIPDTELRAAIGYVPQTPVLFHGTIAQNLRLAAPGATDEELAAICQEVGILDAIEMLPEGLNTLLDHAKQGTLPGGFRQAIAIAQAYARKPQILLLDEPAKTLDHDLEDALIKSISRRRGDTTIIMVSHRPSHIQMADRVIKLERGQLVSFEPPSEPRKAS